MDQTIRNILNTIISQAPSREAREYAQVALNMNMKGETLKTQILYIRANLSTWRGETAREAKKFLVAVTS